MKRMLPCFVVALFLAAPRGSLVAAQEQGPVAIETRLTRVSLFKNGLGFFVREGVLSPAHQAGHLGPFAAPAHGTFWVSSPSSAGMKSVVARSITIKAGPVPARDVADLMRANIGREAWVWPSPDSTAPVRGIILGFAADRPAPVVPLHVYEMGNAGERMSEIIPWGRGEYALIKTDEGVVALNPYSIARVRFTSEAVAAKFQPEIPAAELEAAFASPKAGDWILVSYLAKGITWAPSYLVDLSDSQQARLSAKAVIINEAEDLKATHVDLITGFPNLKFADVLSPLAMKGNLASFLQALAGTGARPEVMANVMTQAVMYRGAGPAGMPGPRGPAETAPSYGAAAAGQTTEDLFLYPIENVTLARGETGYYPLFTESVPYSEFYQWEIPDYINPSDYYVQAAPQPEKPEVVWHSLRLTNTTKVPWTTAPAEVVKAGQIIGQDVLSYTPAKAKSVVKITQAASVNVEQSEVESNRERDAVVMYGDHFDRVTIQGTLRATDYQEKAISLEIKKTVSGDVKSTKPKATDVTLARGLKSMNPLHQLTWTIPLQPQKSQEITYTYQALIRR